MSRRLELTIPPELAGVRVDTILKKRLELSGTVVRRIKWLEDGILVDGQRVNTRFTPREGQVLSVRLDDTERHSGILPVPGPLDIRYEDRDLIVLNKAPGQSVHPGPGHFDDTLGNFLLWHYNQERETADFHPIHRLDRGTSGLIVVAKHPSAQERLKRQLHTEECQRIYMAVCEGAPDPSSGVIEAPIGSVPGSLMKQMVCPEGKPARTWYETLSTMGERSLLRLELDTGRTHQIRVHLAHIGHPLVGDFLYGTERRELIPRPALHSAQLHFCHPVSGKKLSFFLPLPADMEQLMGEGAP